jgi:phage recombination protein Bet
MKKPPGELEVFLRRDEHLAPVGFVIRILNACRHHQRLEGRGHVDDPIESVERLRKELKYFHRVSNVGRKCIEHLDYLFDAERNTMDNKIVPAEFTTEQVELIRRTIAPGATNDELQLFLYQAKRTGLDPLTRQIYAVKRWNAALRRETMAIQVSIDGFRLIAERSGKYAGQVGPFWCGSDGNWRDVWTDKLPPVAARVGALRSDFKEPCWGVARYESYAQKTREGTYTKSWSSMADIMVAKCAEALALRKAFPQELSGLYTGDEMQQIGTADQPSSEPSYVIQLKERTNDGWREFGAELLTAIKEDGQSVPWLHANAATLTLMQSDVPKMHNNLMQSIKEVSNAEIEA